MEILAPDYPDGFFPLKELGKSLNYEVSRLKSICKALSIEVVSIERISYISEEAKPILEEAIKAKRSGANIDYTSTTTTAKVIPVLKNKTAVPQEPNATGLVVRDGAATAAPQEFFQMLVELMKQQQAAPVPAASPIQQQRELKDAVDNGFLLTAEQIANIFGLKKSSVSSWKTGHRRMGFEFLKVKEGSTSLFKVQQY